MPTVSVRDANATTIQATSNTFNIVAGGTMTLTGITLSGTSVIAGSVAGTTVGTIAVQATGGTFNGSLAVDDTYRGQGIGRRLVEWAVEEARRLEVRRIMSLTYEQGFFEKIGFEVVNKDTLPLKVWSDCVRCPKRDGCDEIAMVRTLHDVPMIVMPTTPPTPKGVSIPVLDAFAEVED